MCFNTFPVDAAGSAASTRISAGRLYGARRASHHSAISSGSACTDGGAGLVTALGGRLLDESGIELPPGGAALARLHRIDVSGLRDLSGTEVIAATDVDSPLTGLHGASSVYGPQKGASPADVAFLDGVLARLADALTAATGRDLRAL